MFPHLIIAGVATYLVGHFVKSPVVKGFGITLFGLGVKNKFIMSAGATLIVGSARAAAARECDGAALPPPERGDAGAPGRLPWQPAQNAPHTARIPA